MIFLYPFKSHLTKKMLTSTFGSQPEKDLSLTMKVIQIKGSSQQGVDTIGRAELIESGWNPALQY